MENFRGDLRRRTHRQMNHVAAILGMLAGRMLQNGTISTKHLAASLLRQCL